MHDAREAMRKVLIEWMLNKMLLNDKSPAFSSYVIFTQYDVSINRNNWLYRGISCGLYQYNDGCEDSFFEAWIFIVNTFSVIRVSGSDNALIPWN